MAQMLEKVVVSNVGVLKAFNTPQSPKFKKLTIIYARNGRGKSTLSAILRASVSANHIPIISRRTFGASGNDPEVNLIFENETVRFKNGAWLKNGIPIDVFNTSFITENLYAGEAIDLEHDRSLFTVILGPTGVKLAKQQEFFNAVAKRRATAMKDAENALKDDLPTDQAREEFFAYSPSSLLDEEITTAQKELKSVQQAGRLASLKKLEKLIVPTFDTDVCAILGRTVQNIESTARENLAEHFVKHHLGGEGETWVRFGLDHITDDSCPFCGRADVDDLGLVTVYGQIFGQAYKDHFRAIQSTIEDIERILGFETQKEISRRISSNLEKITNWAEFYAVDASKLPQLDKALEGIATAYDSLKALIVQKRQSPLLPIAEDKSVSKVLKAIGDSIAQFNEYNKAVEEIDKIIDTSSIAPRRSEQDVKLRLLNLMKRKRRSEFGVQRRIETFFSEKRRDARAKNIRSVVQKRLKDANEEAAEHFHGKVNDCLKKFGANFQISKISNSMSGNVGSVDYGLVVRGHRVDRGRGRGDGGEPNFMNALSTGDKTSLAFAFFMAGLDRDQDLKNKIIVFDDPLSSHDTHRQDKTVGLLKELCGRCAQVIVLSHDAHFLRSVAKRCSKEEQVSYEIDYEGAENWAKAKPANLDELCQSDHARQLKKLRTYYDTREGTPSDVAPAVRKVLETYYRSAYSAYFSPTDNLGPIVRKIKEAGPNHPCWNDLGDLESCNEATMNEHHGDNPELVSRSPIDPDGTYVIVRDCLRLINAITRDSLAIALTG